MLEKICLMLAITGGATTLGSLALASQFLHWGDKADQVQIPFLSSHCHGALIH